MDGFYIASAKMQDSQHLRALDQRSDEERVSDRERYGVQVHRIGPGAGTILGYREFNPGDLAIDDEAFDKVTIWIPGNLPDTAWHSSLEAGTGIVVAVTRGGSAWPRDACSGYATEGTLSITPDGDRKRVRLVARGLSSGNRDVWPCKPPDVDIEFTASELRLAELTPWLGHAGDHVYDETYRRTGN